ncbi:ATP-dependent RNA helicase HrpA [Marinicella sp. S1101]|uniref:ATP-dependent RNA helicase HrpA n=1 Tax=Marinicella marina TaxID=2996016 RepID=UPI0022609012|nr:ATP-dependent RNA helicase HrpA [Marinicella marina]MCX7552717.1 ATP-dependent RNA helicase HrpA [Marinicella marina]MDJ1139974.1 ATP-dependent RNA helicase HrpA [Marinicella marina]
MSADIEKLITQLPGHVLAKDLHRLQNQLNNAKKTPKKLAPVLSAINNSQQQYEKRLAALPKVELEAELPISQQAEKITQAIKNNQVTIIAGETGSGKTTQIPKICLQAGLGLTGQIACTQPRRIAAKSVAQRVADEINQPLGQAIGYQVRFDDQFSEDGYVKFMTDGILLQQTLRDKWLNAYDTIIIDEAHERSLNIDFLLGFIKQLIKTRKDLKVVITSATIDTEKFSKHFDDAPIINVSGRSYPVTTHYRSLEENNLELNQGIIRAVDEIYAHDKVGDVLIFLPGEREINEAADQLQRKHLPNTEVLKLYARLTAADQMRIFKPGDKRRVILSTNVAETSLTVPRIHYVIDSGLARISRYSAKSKIQGLQVEPIAQDSANQRQGRCGRIADGHCYRLYSEQDFESRPEHTDAEILRTSLASVILQTHVLKLGHLTDFPFIDQPDFKMINDGYQLLIELEALDEGQQLTQTGKMMAHLPIDVQLSRVLIKANGLGCLRELLVIVAGLSIQDPRERPLEWSQAADKAHAKFNHERSDFMALLKMWKTLNKKRQELKNKGFKQYCRDNFISIKRYMEWRDVNRQLSQLVKRQKMQLNEKQADYEQIHKALLAGFISHIGLHQSDKEYMGTRNKKFMIFPGSGLYGRNPKWLLAGEIVHTSQVFARMVADLDVMWINDVGRHLIKKSFYDPFWSKKHGTVMGYQRSVLLGLVLSEKHQIHYGPKDPKTARELFISQGLVEQFMHTRMAFFHHNAKLIAAIQSEEDRSRKKDLLIDHNTLYDLYDKAIPAGIYSEVQLRKHIAKNGDHDLRFTDNDLYMRQAPKDREQLFPEQISIRNLKLKLSYEFQPGSDSDGVTAHIQLPWLNALNANDFEFLVPGLLPEKLEMLIKGLPKSIRRGLFPIKEYAEILSESLDHNEDFYQQLVKTVFKKNGLQTTIEDWQATQLDDHLKFRFLVYDNNNKTLKSGRDFDALITAFSQQANRSFQKTASKTKKIDGARDWVFGELVEQVQLDNGLPAYQAIVDQGDVVGLRMFEHPQQAAAKHLQGIKKLLQLKYPKIIKQAKKVQISLKAEMAWNALESGQKLIDEVVDALLEKHINSAGFIASQAQFDQLADVLAQKLYKNTYDWSKVLGPVIEKWYQTWQLVEEKSDLLTEATYADMHYQLDYLVYADFVHHVRLDDLSHYQRYFNGLEMRLETAMHSPQKEIDKLKELTIVSKPFYDYCDQVDEFTDEHQDFLMLLEELRVSLFAQSLGTKQKVSVKRLKQVFKAL